MKQLKHNTVRNQIDRKTALCSGRTTIAPRTDRLVGILCLHLVSLAGYLEYLTIANLDLLINNKKVCLSSNKK